MSTLPSTMKAVIVRGDKGVLESNIPLPPLYDGYLLVKVLSVAVNPTDWKHIRYGLAPQGSISGCDCAGEIVKLGKGVDSSKFSVGDKVYGFVHGGSVKFPENGGFAEYASMDAAVAFKAPKGIQIAGKELIAEGPVKEVESLPSLPISLATAGMVLTDSFKVKMEWEPSKTQFNTPLLIWGGATAFGEMLIQLAKRMNAFSKIVVVASKKHETILKEYGADELFDYHDEDVIQQITTKYPNLEYLVDGVSNRGTIQQVYQCARKDGPATVLNLINLREDAIKPEIKRDDVKMISTLLYCLSGIDIPFGSIVLPGNPAYRAAGIKFIEWIQPMVNNGEIRHIPINVYKGGLAVIPQMMADQEAGKNSGEKLVTVL